jgi:hypothetical protein
MLSKIFTIFLFFTSIFVFGQNKISDSKILTHQEIDELFTDSLSKKLDIPFHIYKVFKCIDKSGQFYIVLTKSNDNVISDKDTLNYKITAYNFHQKKSALIKRWEINDFVTKPTNSNKIEKSIWFWTKYSEFKDIDNDSLIDPIIIYSTSGMNFTDDGRTKILIYYKGEKFAIRHQNGVLDFERNTHVDKGFYKLPTQLQDYTKMIMKKMTDDGNAIFPDDWQTAMKNHKPYFDENKKADNNKIKWQKRK